MICGGRRVSACDRFSTARALCITDKGLGGCELRRSLAVAAICGIGLQLLLAGAAFAETQEYSWTRTLGSRVNWTETFSVPKFQSSLGTLTGIEIAYDWSMDCEVGVENLADLASDLTVDLSITTKLQQGGVTLASKTYQQAYTYTGVAADDGTIDWQGDSGRKYQHFFYEDPPAAIYSVPSGSFADYIYTGSGATTIDFQVSALRDYWTPTGTQGSMAAYYKADVPASAKVTYIYAVPEPAAMLSLLVGITGAAGLALRKRRVS